MFIYLTVVGNPTVQLRPLLRQCADCQNYFFFYHRGKAYQNEKKKKKYEEEKQARESCAPEQINKGPEERSVRKTFADSEEKKYLSRYNPINTMHAVLHTTCFRSSSCWFLKLLSSTPSLVVHQLPSSDQAGLSVRCAWRLAIDHGVVESACRQAAQVIDMTVCSWGKWLSFVSVR